MRITNVRIRNFRSIRELRLDLAETTVLVGSNNAGKTAIIDAIRKAMPRRGMQGDTHFDEYDIHLKSGVTDPKASRGICIEIVCSESKPEEWPNNIYADLDDIANVDVNSGCRSITLRTRFAWNDDRGTFEVSREFLDLHGGPLVGKGARRVNLERFGRYLPVFYLNALRDVADEFSPRSSKFWKRLLKAVEIPAETELDVLEKLEELNNKLLTADPKLERISKTLSGAAKVTVRESEGSVDLRMLPMETWDLLSRVDIILRREADLPWLPLKRQGQGIQSLSVMFLFKAFVENLLEELYAPESNPILALEEPEAHLHPQAARTLWGEICELRGQKIITTHSPYFAQYVPLRDLRLVRLASDGTTVRSLTGSVAEKLPRREGLDRIISKYDELLGYDEASGTLKAKDKLGKDCYRELLKVYANATEHHKSISTLRGRSAQVVRDADLQCLEISSRRIRGEIFFAERWLIVEGSSDYLVLHAMAHALGYDFDKFGVSVIDAKNNGGSPAVFAVVARELGIPWLAVFDGDKAGEDYKKGIEKRGFTSEDIKKYCLKHTRDLEFELLTGNCKDEVSAVLEKLRCEYAHGPVEKARDWLKKKKKKTVLAVEVAARLRESKSMAERGPEAFRNAIERIQRLE